MLSLPNSIGSSNLRSKMRASVAIALILVFAGCSGGAAPVSGASPSLREARTVHQLVDPSNYEWVAKFGGFNGGSVTVLCPSGWSAIDGGTNSSNGAPVGTGNLNETKNGWTAPGVSVGSQSEAFVSCVSPNAAGYYQWVHAANQVNVAATCPSGYSLVGGYGVGSIASEFPVYRNNNGPVNEWVISSGSGEVTAHASCVSNSLGVVPNEAPGQGRAIAGCETSGSHGFIIIGGGTGTKDSPGPPRYNYPTGTGVGGGNEWHSFGNNTNSQVVAHAACAPVP
jgi:hypothetical protein